MKCSRHNGKFGIQGDEMKYYKCIIGRDKSLGLVQVVYGYDSDYSFVADEYSSHTFPNRPCAQEQELAIPSERKTFLVGETDYLRIHAEQLFRAVKHPNKYQSEY